MNFRLVAGHANVQWTENEQSLATLFKMILILGCFEHWATFYVSPHVFNTITNRWHASHCRRIS